MSIFDYIPGGNAIDSFLHPERGYEDAAKKMEEAWREAQAAQAPFREAGLGQLGRLEWAEDRLLDPSSLLAEWMSKYEESPWAKSAFSKARQGGLDAASSMGLMGSSAALNNIEKSAGEISAADRQAFLNDLMQKFMAGVGIGQNIYGAGAGVAGNLGNQALAKGGYLGDMAYGAANAPGDRLSQILASAAKAAASAYAGGGGAM